MTEMGPGSHSKRTMLVGINYPWLACGHDFGDDPPQWGGSGVCRDWDTVRREFDLFRALGISAVRCWVLAGGVNFPVGVSWNTIASLQSTPRPGISERLAKLIQKRFSSAKRDVFDREKRLVLNADLPSLPHRFLDDFGTLLSICQGIGLQLIPSLLSFEFFQPAVVLPDGVVKRGRAGFVFGSADRHEDFLRATLDPLLEVSTTFPSTICAWEPINEPDWVVVSGPKQVNAEDYGLLPAPRLVADEDMCAFLQASVRHINAAGFVATIGFKEASPSWLSQELRNELIELGEAGKYIHQLHHYPTAIAEWTLPPHATLPIRPCIVGEFPTAQGGTAGNLRWRDGGLRRSEKDPDRYLSGRISHIKNLGYPGALLWSARATDARSQWTKRQQQQLARWLQSERD